MTGFEEKTMWKLLPWAPIALGMLLTAWAVVVDHGAIATYNDASMPGDPSFVAVAEDGAFIQAANLHK